MDNMYVAGNNHGSEQKYRQTQAQGLSLCYVDGLLLLSCQNSHLFTFVSEWNSCPEFY